LTVFRGCYKKQSAEPSEDLIYARSLLHLIGTKTNAMPIYMLLDFIPNVRNPQNLVSCCMLNTFLKAFIAGNVHDTSTERN
jgi:hypothetical protein